MSNICAAAASAVVDGAISTRFSAADPNVAVTAMVHQVMGLAPPNDVTPIEIIFGHYNAAVASEVSQTDALRPAFMLACLSPVVTGLGE